MPAPYTLSLIEAMCTGTPVVAYNNGCGIVSEGLGVVTANSADDIVRKVLMIMNDRDLAEEVSAEMREKSKMFDVNVVYPQWESFINKAREMCNV
jgi:glycosyltransferase involved in cell wall biosynthesis